MARRGMKIEASKFFTAMLALAAIAIALKFIQIIGILVVFLAALIAAYFFYIGRKRAARFSYLRAKYSDESVARAIMRHEFWEGQTREQLLDARGSPQAIDQVLLKTRKREVWKYQPVGKNRYRVRITLDDDVVVSYENRQ
jgi:hypothetical protein